jgi:hypothetical protein
MPAGLVLSHGRAHGARIAAQPDPWPGGCGCGGGDTMNALAANDLEAEDSCR